MKALALTLLLAGSCACAQAGLTFDTSTGRPSYATLDGGWQALGDLPYTTADLNLYVDRDGGNDANPCTGGDGGACATVQGALNKSPRTLRHRTTVNVATGNYSGFVVAGFTQDNSWQSTTGGLYIKGTLANAALSTGSATGTATSGTAGVTPVWGTLTDSTQSWTSNDLRGKFLSRTGGTGASATLLVISSNTATTLTIVGKWVAPDVTSTYAIQTAATVINTCIASLPTATTNGSGTGTSIAFSANSLNNASGLTVANVSMTCGSVQLLSGGGIANFVNTQSTSTSTTHFLMEAGTYLSFRLSYSAFTTHAHDNKRHIQSVPGGRVQATGALFEQGEYAVNSESTGSVSVNSSETHNVFRGVTAVGSALTILDSRLGGDGQQGEWCVQVGDSHDGMTAGGYAIVSSSNFDNCDIMFQQGGGFLGVGTNGPLTGTAGRYVILNLGGGKAVFTATNNFARSDAGTDIYVGTGGTTANFSDLLPTPGCISALGDSSSVCTN